MDNNKTWINRQMRQVNYGPSMVTLRPNNQNLVSTTGSVCPVVSSSNNWQRMNFSNVINVPSNSSAMSNQQQFNRIQQQLPLRYFQIRKPSSEQYGNQTSSITPNHHYQPSNQVPSQHFSNTYAVLAESSSPYPIRDAQNFEKTTLYPPNVQATITSIPYVQSVRKSSNPRPKSPEDSRLGRDIDNYNNTILDVGNHRRQCEIFENSISEICQKPSYEILTSGHFVISANNDGVSTDDIDTSGPYTSTSSPSASSSSSIDRHVNPQFRKLHSNEEIYKWRPVSPFVNAFDAVPDMLSEVRPGTTTFYSVNRRRPCFLVSQSEFSYHAVKAPREITREPVKIDIVDDEKNYPDPGASNQRSYSSIVDHTDRKKSLVEPRSKKITKKIVNLEVTRDKEKSRRVTKDSNGTINNSLKTYADAVQLTTKNEISFRTRTNEDSRRWAQNRKPPFCRALMSKMAARGATRKKREYELSDDDDDEKCVERTISNLTDRSKNRLSRFENVIDNDGMSRREFCGKSGRSPSRKRLCKMAEMFCLGELENTKFTRSFDDNNRRRRRMSYTVKLQDHNESSCKMATEVSHLSLDRKNELFANNSSSRSRRTKIFANVFNDEKFHDDSTTVRKFRFNGVVTDKGILKVLQKLKECADGSAAIYTNSWRPHELHFVRRYHREKYA